MSTQLHKAGDLLAGRYLVKQYLDEGGMQQVYLARDITFGRKVALKVPKSASAEKRFERSARASALVVHANVAATLDYFESDGKSYLIEELIEGQTLWSRLENDFQFLDPHLAAHVIHHLAKGVAASHHADVFHRDLKPSNIMVSDDAGLARVKITDFGIAKMAKEEIAEAFKDHESTTGSQTVMGALPYMAPEMILDQKSANLPADIWALGALLYQLISGQLPFGRGLGAAATIVTGKLPSQPSLFAAKPQFRPLTDDLWAIVVSCLNREALKRPTADQLVEMCSKLCYSNAPRHTGVIDTFGGRNRGKWGFIDRHGGGSVFFHQDSYFGDSVSKGTKVTFSAFPGVPQVRAFPIAPMK